MDGNAVFARTWFAVVGREGEGVKEDAVLSVAMMSLNKYINKNELSGSFTAPYYPSAVVRPDRMAVILDSASKSDKHRSKPQAYFDLLKEFGEYAVQRFGGITYKARVEADDVLAELARRSSKKDITSYIVTCDKDLCQCISKRIHVYDINKKRIVTPDMLYDKFGVIHPSHIAIYLAVRGDDIDGISGVPGYGAVKTKKIMQGVPKDLKFSGAVDYVSSQLKPDEVSVFLSQLDLTLLYEAQESLPEPLTIVDSSMD